MNKYLNYLKIIFRRNNKDLSNEDKRLRAIALTAITAIIHKIIALITPLITVRITLAYMGEEAYGLWSAVTSLFTLFAYADLGLGSGLQTELSRNTDDKEESKTLISSTYSVLSVVSIGLMLVFIILFPILNWAEIVNAETEEAIAIAGSIVLAIVLPRIINIPFSLINRVQLAYQEGYKYNLWQCFGNALNLICVIIISKTSLGPATMVWASSVATVLVSVINTLVYYGFQRKEITPKLKYFQKKSAIRLLKIGLLFFVLSIFTSLSLSIDNFIVAQAQGLSSVTSYSIMNKIVVTISVVSAMLSTPMWAANGEALSKGEVDWVKKATRKIVLISFGLSAVASIAILILMTPALNWLSKGAIQPDFPLLIGMCIYQIIVSITNPYFMVLNAQKAILFQIIEYIIFGVISLPIKYFLAVRFGVVAVTWVGVVSYFLLITIPTFWKAQLILKKVKKDACKESMV